MKKEHILTHSGHPDFANHVSGDGQSHGAFAATRREALGGAAALTAGALVPSTGMARPRFPTSVICSSSRFDGYRTY
jgi:hypothetical protein